MPVYCPWGYPWVCMHFSCTYNSWMQRMHQYYMINSISSGFCSDVFFTGFHVQQCTACIIYVCWWDAGCQCSIYDIEQLRAKSQAAREESDCCDSNSLFQFKDRQIVIVCELGCYCPLKWKTLKRMVVPPGAEPRAPGLSRQPLSNGCQWVSKFSGRVLIEMIFLLPTYIPTCIYVTSSCFNLGCAVVSLLFSGQLQTHI